MIIVENFEENNTPDMKYYAFDWDDNIVYMPTEIILIDNEGEEVGMSTHDFAKYRSKIGSSEFEYRGTTIVNYATYPFRQFKTDGDNQFLEDVMIAKLGPAFDDFKEAINNGSIFSIITARGHNPNTLRKAVKIYIENNFNGINKNRLVHNLKKYRDISDESLLSDDEMVDAYLILCKFYPVSFGDTGSAANPEDAKVDALNEFYSYCKKLSNAIKKKYNIKKDISGENRLEKYFSMGFSDDDPKNLETIKKRVKKDNLTIYSTNKGKKEIY
jgi:hypothetical protein